jgi:hypothetical protein
MLRRPALLRIFRVDAYAAACLSSPAITFQLRRLIRRRRAIVLLILVSIVFNIHDVTQNSTILASDSRGSSTTDREHTHRRPTLQQWVSAAIPLQRCSHRCGAQGGLKRRVRLRVREWKLRRRAESHVCINRFRRTWHACVGVVLSGEGVSASNDRECCGAWERLLDRYVCVVILSRSEPVHIICRLRSFTNLISLYSRNACEAVGAGSSSTVSRHCAVSCRIAHRRLRPLPHTRRQAHTRREANVRKGEGSTRLQWKGIQDHTRESSAAFLGRILGL